MNTNSQSPYTDPHSDMAISSKSSKKIIGKIRGGNYQHPGEESAIDMLFDLSTNKKPSAHILDVGCGLGATAAYVNNHRWGSVVGIDINQDLIDEARLNYADKKELVFIQTPVERLDQDLKKIYNFDIIYAFNSFFLFSDHRKALDELFSVSHHETELLIFDYIDYGDYHKYSFIENNKKLLPSCIDSHSFMNLFECCSWNIHKTINISKDYIHWYEQLLKKLQKEDLNHQSSNANIKNLLLRYEHIYEMLTKEILGGIMIYAKPVC